jgi:hypothetical protein
MPHFLPTVEAIPSSFAAMMNERAVAQVNPSDIINWNELATRGAVVLVHGEDWWVGVYPGDDGVIRYRNRSGFVAGSVFWFTKYQRRQITYHGHVLHRIGAISSGKRRDAQMTQYDARMTRKSLIVFR